MSKLFIRPAVAVAVAMWVLWLAPGEAAKASSAEQIVFSGISFDPSIGPYGFWIWCQNSNPGQGLYNGECAGSMYVYARETPEV